MNRQRIGITTCNTMGTRHGSPNAREYLTYRRAIEGCGAEAILIRMDTTAQELEQFFDQCDGFLLSGGDDVDPALYNQERSSRTKGIRRRQDELEIRIARWAAENQRPLLGICRGCQVINVAFGGTLFQHIADELPGALNHDQHRDFFGEKKSRTVLFHKVDVIPGSLLERIVMSAQMETNSLHHQGLNQIGAGLSISAVVPDDGLVEAVEISGHPFFLGVQWHPEELTALGEHRRIFEAFAEACKR